MFSVQEAVEKLVRTSPIIEDALSCGIANYSALARFIHPQVETAVKKRVTSGAIIMSLRRLDPISSWPHHKKPLFSKPPDLIVRSNLTEFTVPNSKLIGEEYRKVVELAGIKNENFLALSQGLHETTVICSDDSITTVQSFFQKEQLLSFHHGLSGISIKLEKSAPSVSGLYYHILKLLAWENISIIVSISTVYEFTIILNDEDVERAFSVLKNNLGKSNVS